MSLPPGADVAAVLELSDEREQWRRLALSMWRNGWRACWAVAYAAGRADEAAEREAAWRRSADLIVAQLDRDSPQARELAATRVRVAEAGCRRDAWEHWHGFIRQAHETPPWKRTEVQRASVVMFPGPQAGAA